MTVSAPKKPRAGQTIWVSLYINYIPWSSFIRATKFMKNIRCRQWL